MDFKCFFHQRYLFYHHRNTVLHCSDVTLLFSRPGEEAGSLCPEDEHHSEVPPRHLHQEQRELHFLLCKVRMNLI